MTDIVPTEPGLAEVFATRLLNMTKAADRVGTTEAIADIVLLITSARGRWITGQYISASGVITVM